MSYKMLNSSFAVSTEGTVLPLTLVNQRENRKIEALAHIDLFHRYFYELDAAAYQENLEKALWLGNTTVDNIYRQKRADGVYNRLVQYGLVQKVLSIKTTVDVEQEAMPFRTVTIFEITRGSTIDRYELTTTGKLTVVERHFPRNSHGLLITDFFENSLRKLTPGNIPE